MKIDYISILDKIISEELEKKKEIALYPYGKYGKIGKQIVHIKYGVKTVYCIDNICEDDGILRMEEFLEKNRKNVTLIITTVLYDLNYKLQSEVETYGISCRNVLEPVIEEGEERFRRERERHRKENTIVVLGDSHVNLFSGNEGLSYEYLKKDMRLCPTVNSMPFSVIHMGPCLAYNCNRYGTNNQFREKFEWLEENFLQKGDTLMISLGEIDMRVHVFAQGQKRGKKPEEVADIVLEEYMIFIRDLKDKGYHPIALGPVAVGDAVHSADLSRIGTVTEINRIIEYYTCNLMKECKKEGVSCLSVFDELINEDYTSKAELQVDGCHLKQQAMTLYYSKLFKMI